MKKKISREVKIGIFGISMVLLLYLGINYIKNSDLFSRDYNYYAIYENSEGLEASSPVTIKGYQVGSVKKVWYDIRMDKVIVEFSVKHAYPIPLHSEAKISSTSLLGSKVIELRLGESPLHMKSGDTIRSLVEPDLLQMATGEYDRLRSMASSLADQISQALLSINQVLSPENVSNISGMFANLNSLSGRMDGLVENELSQTLHSLQTIFASLEETTPKVNSAMDKFNVIADSLTVSVPTLLANAAASVNELTTALGAVNTGEGTAGKLVYDNQLYDNLSGATRNLELLLEDLKRNPGRYINISVFGGRNK